MMSAGLERDIGRGALGSLAGLGKGDELGVGPPTRLCPPLRDDLPVAHDDTADCRVGSRATERSASLSQRLAHEASIVLGPARRSGGLRHARPAGQMQPSHLPFA